MEAFIVFIFLVGLSGTSATEEVDASLRFSETKNDYEKQYKEGKRPTVAEALKIQNKDITFKEAISIDLPMVKMVKTKMIEYYKNVPVYNTNVVVGKDKETGKIKNFYGSFYEGIEKDLQDVTPKYSKEQALKIGKKDQHDTNKKIELMETKLHIYVHSGKAHLTWHVVYLIEPEKDQPTFEVDAHSGKVIDEYNGFIVDKFK